MFYIYESLQCSIARTEKFSPSSRFFVSSSILPPLYKEEDKPHVERQDENSHNAHHQYDDDGDLVRTTDGHHALVDADCVWGPTDTRSE